MDLDEIVRDALFEVTRHLPEEYGQAIFAIGVVAADLLLDIVRKVF